MLSNQSMPDRQIAVTTIGKIAQEALAQAPQASVVGMTSRGGRDRTPLLSPEVLAKRIVPLSHHNAIGLVFGSEREGLTN